MRRLIGKTLADPAADTVIRSHAEAIVELQGLALAGARVIRGVSLPDSTHVVINHKLGRAPIMVIVSPPRGAASFGSLIEVDLGASQPDRAQAIILEAVGYGATVAVDVTVF